MQIPNPLPSRPESASYIHRFVPGLTWLIVLPAAVWGVAAYYLPVLGSTLDRMSTWLVSAVILLLAGASLAAHVLAHRWMSHRLGLDMPVTLGLLVCGETSQAWPSAGSTRKELLSAAVGPLTNLLLAGLTYLLWTRLVENTLNLITLAVCGFNAWLFLINLIPVYPLDGGRLVAALLRGTWKRPAEQPRKLRAAGWILAGLLVAWGIFLILQNSRFSPETGLITFLCALLLLDGSRFQPAAAAQEASDPHRRWLRLVGAGGLGLILAVLAGSLLLVNNGLEAPGVALPVAPMIEVPYRLAYAHTGEFYLVSVISQAPITAGEWLIGQLDPALQIVPPESVTPKNTTPQRQAAQDLQMLDTSETTAIAVGLRLAGYSTVLTGRGVQVDSILSGSHANGLLDVGDVITSLNGTPVQTADDLINLVGAQKIGATVRLQVKRGQAQLEIDVPLMPPQSAGSGPRIGIEIQTAGFDYHPPFPVTIFTDKISGGPSAGLMFTLSVYNALSPDDLTRGWRIAGTGTINLDGSVGPIGGVKQKVFAAQAAGASYFLCPVDNYKDAVSVARGIRVVQVADVDQALQFLRGLPARSSP